MKRQKVLTKEIIEKILAKGQVPSLPSPPSCGEDEPIDKDLQQNQSTETSPVPELLSPEELEEFMTLDDRGFMPEESNDDTVPLKGKDYLQKVVWDFTHIESSAMKLLHESSVNLWGSPLLYDFLFEPLQCFNISKMKLEWNGAGDDGYYEIYITFGEDGTQIKGEGSYDPWSYPLDEILFNLLNLPPGAEIDTGSVGSISVDVQNGEIGRFYKNKYHEELLEFLTAFRDNGVQKAYFELSLDRVRERLFQKIRFNENKPLGSKTVSDLFPQDVIWRISQMKIYKGDQWFDDKSWHYEHLRINEIFSFFENDYDYLDDLKQLVEKLFGPKLHKLSPTHFSEPLKLIFLVEEGKIEFSFLGESFEIDLVSNNENNCLSLDEINLERLKALRQMPNPSCNFIREIMPEVDASVETPSEWMLDRYTSLAEDFYSEYEYEYDLSQVLTKEIAKKILNDSEFLHDQCTSIDDEAAELLADYDEEELFLSVLTSISDATAESLSRFKGDTLYLDGLTELSDAAAESLSKHNGYLYLRGLTELSDAAAESLAKHKGVIYGLKTDYESDPQFPANRVLSKEIAEQFIDKDEYVDLALFWGIDNEAAKVLSMDQSGELDLSGIERLSDVAAKNLSMFGGDLDLSGLNKLSEIALESFSDFEGCLDLFIPQVFYPDRFITEDKAQQFLGGKQIRLYEFGQIKTEAAEILAISEKELDLRGLISLSDSCAKILSKHNGNLYLDGLKNLTVESANSLSKYKGDLWLNGLAELNSSIIDCFAEYKGSWLSLDGLKNLTDESAEKLGQVDPRNLCLPKPFDELLTPFRVVTLDVASFLIKNANCLNLDSQLSRYGKLDEDAAESLSKYDGHLTLDGLTELSDAAAESLSKCKGDLYLAGLTQLSDAAAESLSKCKGYLRLDGLTELSDAAAKSLSEHEGELDLDGLTELGDAAVESLSRHKGGIHLRGVENLSQMARGDLTRENISLS